MVNNYYDASQSDYKLSCDTLHESVFKYSNLLDTIIEMFKRSNSSQKNKGDVGELVSLPFTC